MGFLLFLWGGNALFIPLSKSAAKSLSNSNVTAESILEVLFIGSNLAVVPALEFWCGNPIIFERLKTKTANEEAIGRKVLPLWQRTLIDVGFLALALISQLPSAFAGMKDQKEEYKAYAGALILLRGSIFPFRSMLLKVKQRLIYFSATEDGKKCLKQQSEALAYLEKSKSAFLALSGSEDKQAHLNRMSEALENLSSIAEDADLRKYLDDLFLVQDSSFSALEDRSKVQYKDWASFLSVHALTILEGYVMSAYTFDGAQNQLSASIAQSVILAFLVFATNYELSADAMKMALSQLLSISPLQSKNLSLPEQFYPKTAICLKTLVALLDVFALGVSYTIWSDSKQAPFLGFMCFTTLLIFLAATNDLSNQVLEEAISRYGTAFEKQCVALSRQYDAVGERIKEVRPEYFPTLRSYLPQNVQRAIQEFPPLTGSKEERAETA